MSLEIHLEAMFVRTWRPSSSKVAEALGHHDQR